MKFFLTFILISICFKTACGQEWWNKSTSWLDKNRMELSIGAMGGVSYFEYNTKAIEQNFPSAEITIEALLGKRLAQNLKLQAGVRVSFKLKKNADYDYESPQMSITEFRYGLVDVDHVMSKYSHKTFGIPVKLQYHPGKIGLTFGGLFRHFAGSRTSELPSDWLAGRYDAGLLGGVGLDIKRFRVGLEYYHGVVNVHKQGNSDAIGGPPRVSYNTYCRYAQFAIAYRFGKE